MEDFVQHLRNRADSRDQMGYDATAEQICKAADRIETLEDRLADAYQMVGNVAYHLAETKEDQQDNLTALLDLLSKD